MFASCINEGNPFQIYFFPCRIRRFFELFPGVSLLAAFFLITNVPVSAQCRFPVMASFFVGNGTKPPAHLLVDHLWSEMKNLAENPITWTDQDGALRSSRVFLTSVSTDAPAKAEFLSVVYLTFQSCPYCKTHGVRVRKSEYPECFQRRNKFLNPTDRAKERCHAVKFPLLVHEENAPLWTDEERCVRGRDLLQRQESENNYNLRDDGLKGLPALYNLPNFRDTWSNTSDFLHVACEGLAKNMLNFMLNSVGHHHSLRFLTS